MTILSKSPWEERVQELSLLLLKFVVVGLVPLRSGNEFETHP